MFRELLTLEEARQIINQHFSPKQIGVDEIPLLEAHNRILAKDITASLDIPPFDRSTVDGHAVKAEDTYCSEENKPIKLKVCGTVNVGEPTAIEVKHGLAAEIVTGAPVPRGADAVVMLENTEREDNDLCVYSAVAKGENIMQAGTDIKKGETVLKKGQSLGSREIGALAAIGVAKAKVHAIPRVAVISTGAEVTEPGNRLPPGKVYDINAYSLSAAISESGGEPVYLGVFLDNFTEIQRALREALSSADLVVTSGGVSVGPKDVMPKVLNSLGEPGVIVCGIAIKPGKPVTIASVGGKPVFSLPGHPTSALLVFHLLVRPIIRAMAGKRARDYLEVNAFGATRMFPAKGRRTFIMVKLKRDHNDRLIAEPVPSGLSGAIMTLARADGFVEIPENQQYIDTGEEVTVQLLEDYAH